MSKFPKLPFASKASDRPASNHQHFLNVPAADFWRDPDTAEITSVQEAWDRAVEQTRKEK